MKKRLLGMTLGLMVSAFCILANVASASACLLAHYQPEVPQALRK